MKNGGSILVVNLSLRSIRIIIFSSRGKKIYEDWLPVRTSINGFSVEQDPEEWWSLLQELLLKASREDFPQAIAAITVTASALCLIPVDKKGVALIPAIMVSDKRATTEAKNLLSFDQEYVTARKLKVDQSYMLPKIMWLKKHASSVFSKTHKFLSANDFLYAKLSGEFVTDTLNAEKFYFDQQKNAFPKKLLSYTGISLSMLPAVVHPGTVYGMLSTSVQKRFGFKPKTRMIVSTYDAICAVIGGSSHEEGVLSNVCGTCSSYRIISSVGRSSDRLLVQELASEKLTIIGGSNNLEGGVLEWAKDSFYSEYPHDDSFRYQLMEQEASESPLGAGGLLFLPYLLGERLPITDAYVRGILFGLERFHTRKDIMRSIFEATAYQAKMMVEEFEKSGIPIESITMSGGVAKIPLAAKIRADVLGIPVDVLSEVETTALGAFIFVKKATGMLSSIRDGKKYIKVKNRIIPNMHNHNCYASLYMLYKELYSATTDLFIKRHKIVQEMTHYQKRVLENL